MFVPHTMKTKITRTILSITFLVLTGCSLHSEELSSPKDLFFSGAEYQHEKDVIITILRYMHLYSIIDPNDIEVKKELDWYIDLMIMELESNQSSQIKLPHKIQSEIDSVKNFSLDNSGTLTIKSICKRIAEFRKNNPRVHTNTLGNEEKRLIESFINRNI